MTKRINPADYLDHPEKAVALLNEVLGSYRDSRASVVIGAIQLAGHLPLRELILFSSHCLRSAGTFAHLALAAPVQKL